MRSFTWQFIAVVAFVALSGCATSPKQGGGYAYLAPYVQQEANWTPEIYFQFLRHLSDKDLVDLAVAYRVAKPNAEGISDKGEVLDPVLFINTHGGRGRVIYEMQRALIRNVHRLTGLVLSADVPYDNYVRAIAGKYGVTKEEMDGEGTYEVEQALWRHVRGTNGQIKVSGAAMAVGADVGTSFIWGGAIGSLLAIYNTNDINTREAAEKIIAMHALKVGALGDAGISKK